MPVTFFLAFAAIVGCTGADTDSDTGGTALVVGPVDDFPQVACDAAGDEGLALHVLAGAVPRYDDGYAVFVRVWPDHRPGFEEVLPSPPALERGAVVVTLLEPGTSMDGHASGGPVGESGTARVEAVNCALRYVRGDTFPVTAGPVVLTGVSFGAGTVMHAALEPLADGAVLFEAPLVDQLVTLEPTPQRTLDPSFVPGTCTLDGGCPFPGRGPALVWSGSDLFHDLNSDRVKDDGEPVLALMQDPTGGSLGLPSVELFDEVAANSATVFDAAVPARWPTRAATLAYWASRDATVPLQRVRDEGLGRWLFIATATDHVQVLHEHVRVMQEALPHAAWFRLDPDAAYLSLVGAPAGLEFPAFATVADPDAPGALPEAPDGLITLAAELELADRAHANDWSDDLDAVLAP